VPGGFIEMDEELEDAVARELEEETGLTGVALEQLRAFGTVGRDPRGRQITVVFTGIVEGPARLCAGDDAAKARWFDIDRLPADLAFDHDRIARVAIRRLKRTKAYQRFAVAQRRD
ncbi:MAG: NUDIX hydrolase, partial [Planctomycetota bacterium]|nr:NUDIX hydrolase [Planctomycetota bacterium]